MNGRSKEAILNKALAVLMYGVGLTSTEISRLRLSHLHLAGKKPHISFTPAEGAPSKTVELDLEAHRALVGWLVARPDSVSDFLFVAEGQEEGLSLAEIERAAEAAVEADPGLAGPMSAQDEPDDALAKQPETTPEPDEAPEQSGAGGQTVASPTQPDAPVGPPPATPAAPKPPPSTPEVGAPPPGLDATRRHPPFPQPPPTAPEADEATEFPAAGPERPRTATEPDRTPDQSLQDREAAKPFPPPPSGPRVPPKPVRKQKTGASPELVRQEPEPPPSPASPQPVEADTSAASQPPASPIKTETVREESPGADAGLPRKVPPKPPRPGRKQPEPAPARRSPLITTTVAGGVLVLLLCFLCGGGAGWLFLQSEPGAALMAGLGFVPAPEPEPDVATEGTAEAAEFATPTKALSTEQAADTTFESPISPVSPPSTPTLPPTSTPTPPPPTNTPVPTETATPVSEATEPPSPTPPPTDTPAPTDTPTLAATAAPAESPTPVASPTPALKYDAPVLLAPENGKEFVGINEIILKWEPVAELAPDEQYAVRLVYQYNGQTTYQGANIKEAQWVVPLSLYRKIDPPENRYEWFVVVERLNNDGSGTAISPESERFTFTWK